MEDKIPCDDLLTLNYCKWRFDSPTSVKPDPRISHGIVHLFHGSCVEFQPWQFENLRMNIYSEPQRKKTIALSVMKKSTVTILEIPVAQTIKSADLY